MPCRSAQSWKLECNKWGTSEPALMQWVWYHEEQNPDYSSLDVGKLHLGKLPDWGKHVLKYLPPQPHWQQFYATEMRISSLSRWEVGTYHQQPNISPLQLCLIHRDKFQHLFGWICEVSKRMQKLECHWFLHVFANHLYFCKTPSILLLKWQKQTNKNIWNACLYAKEYFETYVATNSFFSINTSLLFLRILCWSNWKAVPSPWCHLSKAKVVGFPG